jgi:hypothetical protein
VNKREFMSECYDVNETHRFTSLTAMVMVSCKYRGSKQFEENSFTRSKAKQERQQVKQLLAVCKKLCLVAF